MTDASGRSASRGRNRIHDHAGNAGLGRTRIAHAEMNALAALSSETTHEAFTLYTTLEPCHMCLSAAFAVRIGSLRYAASDPWGGAVGKLIAGPDHEAHPIDIAGPLEGRAGLLPELLPISHFLWRIPKGKVVTYYRLHRPDLVTAAEKLPAPDAGATLEDAAAVLAEIPESVLPSVPARSTE